MKLIDKYAPENLDDLILSDSTKQQIKIFLSDMKKMDNLIFYSKENGTGKTSAAIMIAKKWTKELLGNSNVIQIKGSELKADDIVSLENKISTMGKRIVVINEVDRLHSQTQTKLGELIENRTTSGNTYFILTTNELDKIESMLANRCRQVSFEPVDIESALKDRLVTIFEKEKGQKATDNDVSKITEIANTNKSIRQSIMKLGTYIDTGDVVSDELIQIALREEALRKELAELNKKKVAIQVKEKEDKFKGALFQIEASYTINDFLQYLVDNKKLDSKSFVKQLIESKLVNATDFEEEIEAQQALGSHRKISIPLACYKKDGEIIQLKNPGQVKKEDWWEFLASEILERQTTHVWIDGGEVRGVWNEKCGDKPDNFEEYQEVKTTNGEDSSVTYWADHHGKRTKYTCKMISINKLTASGSKKETRSIKKELETA
ncbi:AAA family ATPase [Vibrio fluvialis]|nr:AAA family ATPase [Vibrio fluvialis]MBY7917744.1 AAA family ATPase [Vibrio fluvialis]